MKIMFRGKSVKLGKWVYGDGIHYPKSLNYKGTCWIDGMHERANDWVQVIPETIGIGTNLTDRSGKEIFEGDVLESQASENKEDWKRWKVVFEDGGIK